MRTAHIVGAALFAIAAALLIPAGVARHDLGVAGGGVCALMLGIETWRRRPGRRG